MLDVLTHEYGFDIDDVAKLKDGLWSQVKKPGRLEEICKDLAQCRTTGHVNAYIRRINYNEAFGRGARFCKFARAIPVHESVPALGSTSQTSIKAFFRKG